MSQTSQHQDAEGRPRMVDVSTKSETRRVAVAQGEIAMAAPTLAALQAGRLPKGDPLLVAQLAGIQGAKRTAELIPLCHPLPLDAVDVQVEADPSLPGVRVTATARTTARTGVEMEAMTAVALALLTVYDMLKGLDRGMSIRRVRLRSKEGGASGSWKAPDESGDL